MGGAGYRGGILGIRRRSYRRIRICLKEELHN